MKVIVILITFLMSLASVAGVTSGIYTGKADRNFEFLKSCTVYIKKQDNTFLIQVKEGAKRKMLNDSTPLNILNILVDESFANRLEELEGAEVFKTYSIYDREGDDFKIKTIEVQTNEKGELHKVVMYQSGVSIKKLVDNNLRFDGRKKVECLVKDKEQIFDDL